MTTHPCYSCRAPAEIALTASSGSVIRLCVECATRIAVEKNLPSLAAAVEHYKATAAPPVPPGMFALRVRPGVQRDDAGRWRAIVYVTGTRPIDAREYTGKWFKGADAEQRAEAIAQDLAVEIRARISRDLLRR